jgi:5'(3')-deoxyribonucleotidase
MSNSPIDYDTRADRVDEICLANPNIFHNLEPMPDSIEYVKKLFDLYEVYFLSTPMWIVPESFIGKRLWIEQHFGKMAVKRLILTHRKDLNIGDYLVDDRKHNGAGEFTGEHIHFATDRFPDWQRVYEYLWTKDAQLKLAEVERQKYKQLEFAYHYGSTPHPEMIQFMTATGKHGKTDPYGILKQMDKLREIYGDHTDIPPSTREASNKFHESLGGQIRRGKIIKFNNKKDDTDKSN